MTTRCPKHGSVMQDRCDELRCFDCDDERPMTRPPKLLFVPGLDDHGHLTLLRGTTVDPRRKA